METYKNIINSYIFQLNIWCIHDFFVFLPANHIFIMNIKILSAKQFATKLKATIQASGRLGFTADTATALGLESGKFARCSTSFASPLLTTTFKVWCIS